MTPPDPALRRIVNALRWRLKRHQLGMEAAAALADARSLGFPLAPQQTGGSWIPAPPPARPLEPAAAGPANGAAAATVCTLDHLHFALALACSIRRHHPDLLLHILVVDGDGVDLPDVPGSRLLRGSDVGLLADPYLALKYSATDLCCAAKPFLLQHVAATSGAEVVVYLDADLYLFAPLQQLLERATRSNFVVFPHTVAPMPQPELHWNRPTLGQLAWAGVLNAGLFSMRSGEAASRFLETWRDLVTAPGAFLESRGGQTEQNSFNWIVAFTDDVDVMRDTTYNVAYWNLHERAIRWTGDGPDGPRFTIEGRPLVAFHFSGFVPGNPLRLCSGNHLHPVHCDRALGRLLTFYSGELAANDAANWSARTYRFATFSSGIVVDRRMRQLFKEYEPELRREVDPFSPAGEATYCRALLSPTPGAGSLLPVLLAAIYRERSDLRTHLPDADVDPEPLLRWFSRSGVHETGYGALFDTHRPVLPRSERLRSLATARARIPDLFAPCAEALGRDRQRLLARLEEAQEDELAREIRDLEGEIYAASPIFVVWRLVRERKDLRESYPDLLEEGALGFTVWLRIFGTRLELLPRDAPVRFARAARGGALARIFSFLNRNTALARSWPLALAGVDRLDFARFLLAHLAGAPEYDLDDVVMYLWLMEERPWCGLPLVLELLANAHHSPSPLLEEGQEALLAPLLASRPEFRQALDGYRARHRSRATVASPGPEASPTFPGSERRPGVNLFGYFRSPIGLGNMSRGLACALRSQQVEVSENLLFNLAMAPELRPEDFVRRFDFGLDSNIFVTFPHLDERLLEVFPPLQIASRRNVGYLAWEQREASPLWEPFLRGFDQVWALSSFAAGGLAEALGREVLVVPCAVDPAELSLEEAARQSIDGSRRQRKPRSRRSARLEDRFSFLHIFDANSSIERKNPEAVVAAFARAFAPGEPASLWIRIANAQRWPHRRRLHELVRRASATGLDIRFFSEPMSRAGLLELLVDADCYVSLHRAEGFGLTCAEAMALGKPTIATGYSGNLDFMSRENSLLVDYREVEVRAAEGPFRGGSLWAEPSVDHAAEQMRWVYVHRDAAAELGAHGRATVIARCSPAAVGAIAAAALAELR